jgi:MOSC domain-containing protein YiiM
MLSERPSNAADVTKRPDPNDAAPGAAHLVKSWPDPVFAPELLTHGLPPQVMAIARGTIKPLWPETPNTANPTDLYSQAIISAAASGAGTSPPTKKPVLSAIRCTIISSLAEPKPIDITDDGVLGDEHADPTVHGGMQKAVYLYPAEHYAFWSTVSAQANQPAPLAPGGAFGENLTVRGLLEKEIYVGDVLRMGEVILRVTSPRSPCFKFNALMGFKQASRLMVQSGFTGFYAMVIRPGKLAAGAPVTIEAGSRIVSIHDMHHTNYGGSQGNLF